jgi:hypothetical protein
VTLTAGRSVLAVLAGICIVAVGFLAGRALGGNDSAALGDERTPEPIATQHVSVTVPTLGSAKRIPALDVPKPPVETAVEETTPSYTPETESPAPEVESPAPSPEPPPEVTVAPSSG